jgi:hypothetical protein
VTNVEKTNNPTTQEGFDEEVKIPDDGHRTVTDKSK